MEKDGFIVIKADSLEKALKKARAELNASQENLEFKVVSREKHGFVFQKETVVIKARKKEPDLEQVLADVLGNSEHLPEPPVISADGSIEITAGKVKVKNPQKGGKYPAIEPGQNVTVTVNGELISKAAIVSAEDIIKIDVCNPEPSVELDVEISEDKLNAFLVINRRFGKKLQVKDCPPCVQARVTAEVTETVPPRKISPREVMELLKEKGIVYGVNESAISRLLESEREGTERGLIAAGHPAEPGKDAWIEYVFNRKTDNLPVNPYSDAVDMSVEVGEVLAVKRPPREGKAGKNIFGEPLLPNPPKDAEILTGEGVKLVQNNTVAVANIAGRPVLEGNRQKVLKVVSVYTVPGDVDVHVGNITFKGDIEVAGSVLEAFSINAGGNIIVRGNVIQAELNAGGNIIVYKNVISSELNAGNLTLVYKRLLPELKKTASLIQNLLQAMQLLKNHRSFKVNDLEQREGRLVQLLIDTKFKEIPKLIQKVLSVIAAGKISPPPDLAGVLEKLQRLTGLNPLRIQKGQELFDIIRTLEQSIYNLQEKCDFTPSSTVTVSYIQNSVVNASGDIVITGRGAITSELSAGENIIIENTSAVVRGGRLSSGKKIKVNELGSNTNVICTVRINEGTVLEARLVHPAVVLESDFGKYVFDDLSRSVKAYISAREKLEVEKLKAR